MPSQLSVNFINEYYDIETDQPGGAPLISRGSSVLLRETVRWIALSLIAFSPIMGMLFLPPNTNRGTPK